MAVKNKVKKIILARLGGYENIDEMPTHGNFVDDLGADSIDLMEIGMALEDEFDIDIPLENAIKLLTVQNIIDYVESHC